MATVHGGTDNDYTAIADIHLYRNLVGAGNSEYMFESGNTGQPMMDWYSWMNKVLFNTEYYSPQDRQKILNNSLKTQDKQGATDVRINGKSNYDIISEKPYLSKFKRLLDYVGYNKIYTAPLTILAPIDDNFDATLTYLRSLANLSLSPADENLPWAGPDRVGWTMALYTVQYHLLPYRILPWQLKDRKLNLRTDLEKQWIQTDFTHGNTLLINPICTYQPPGPAGANIWCPGDPIPSVPDNWFPKKEWEVSVLESYETNNGMLYVISRPLLFPSTF